MVHCKQYTAPKDGSGACGSGTSLFPGQGQSSGMKATETWGGPEPVTDPLWDTK